MLGRKFVRSFIELGIRIWAVAIDGDAKETK